jgi:glycosyltransferase involved in cell wall biosynthesis
MSEIMVSIVCPTYNHVEFIRDALDGFVMQDTDFKYDVFIFDDASDDGTSEIVREYEKKYPEIFNVFISVENTWRSPERTRIINELYQKYITGKYVAICEGDDYWTESNKLQCQVEYMEKNPDCMMTSHASLWIDYEESQRKIFKPYATSGIIKAEDIILQPNGNISTASLIMRKEIFFKEKLFPTCDVGDWPWQLYAISKGNVYYFDKVMSVYRYMTPGSWTKKISGSFEKIIIHNIGMTEFLKKYDYYTHYKFHDSVRKKRISYLYGCVNAIDETVQQDVEKKCNDIVEKNGEKYRNYLDSMRKIYEILKERYTLTLDEKKELKSYEHVVIMGNGNYACHIQKMLIDNGIRYVGNMVTNNTGHTNIWSLETYPYDKEKTVVVIGIHQNSETDISVSLKNYEFHNICTPLWFDVKD